MTMNDAAWAAGLFEGEGCFHFSRKGQTKNTRVVSASLTSTDEDVVVKFANIAGFGRVRGPITNGNEKHKPYWTWRVASFEQVQYLICMFWNYLGIRRKAKAKEILNTYHSFPVKFQLPKRMKRSRLSDDECSIIREKLAAGIGQAIIACKFNVSPSLISRIKTGGRHAGGVL